MAKFTQQAIRMSLLKLLEEKSIDKVTVKDICEMCEINRNTFYYYYSDVYQVVEDILRMEMELSLSEDMSADTLYEEYLNRYRLVLEHKKAVWHIYDSKNREMLLDYFYTVTEVFVTKFVRLAAKGTVLSEEDIRFIVDFYSNSFIGNTLRWIKSGMPDKRDELIHRMTLAYQATIKTLIDSCIEDRDKH